MGPTMSSIFWITPPQKIASVFIMLPRDYHPNTIENVVDLFYFFVHSIKHIVNDYE
jgi:hypothetical protein